PAADLEEGAVDAGEGRLQKRTGPRPLVAGAHRAECSRAAVRVDGARGGSDASDASRCSSQRQGSGRAHVYAAGAGLSIGPTALWKSVTSRGSKRKARS